MSPFRRFQKYVVKPHFEDILEAQHLTNFPAKGPLLAKVTGALWQSGIIQPLAQMNNVSPDDVDKFKKSKVFKQQADQEITNVLRQFKSNPGAVGQFEAAMTQIISETVDNYSARDFLE